MGNIFLDMEEEGVCYGLEGLKILIYGGDTLGKTRLTLTALTTRNTQQNRETKAPTLYTLRQCSSFRTLKTVFQQNVSTA